MPVVKSGLEWEKQETSKYLDAESQVDVDYRTASRLHDAHLDARPALAGVAIWACQSQRQPFD